VSAADSAASRHCHFRSVIAIFRSHFIITIPDLHARAARLPRYFLICYGSNPEFIGRMPKQEAWLTRT